MGVRVKLYSRLREAGGGVDEIVLDEVPATVGELLEELAKRLGDEFRRIIYGEGGRLRENIMLLVNGHSIKLLKGLETRLREDDSVSLDVIDIMEVVGGG